MNRCITKHLALLSREKLLAAAPQGMSATTLTRAAWTSTGSRLATSPSSTFSTQLRQLHSRLSSAACRARQLCRPVRAGGGRRGVRWPARLSDRTKERCGIALAASWFTMLTVQSECDEVDFDLLVKNKLLNPDEEQTGWDRLAAMYTLDEMGGLTPELELVTNIATAGLLIGGSLGAMLNGRLAIIKFVERNQATPFESQIVAKRALQDRLTLGMARGFFIFGWRTALFTSAFTLVSTTLMVYTNQISALHYCCGGVVAGALYKASMGLRGMTAGAVAGGILGLIGGGVFSLTCYLTGTTLPKLRYQQYLWKHQQELRNKARAERKREKKRLEAEKKLEQEKAELAQTQRQEAAMLSMSSPKPSEERAVRQNDAESEVSVPDSVSSESAEAGQDSTNSHEAVRDSSSSEDNPSVDNQRRTESGLEAAVAAATAAVVGPETRDGDVKKATQVS
ncbi:complex I assembly factor TIMMDC1, mitochondrial-like [Amphibalanus amphitrite]|uniref:complex I assembly factor TIMMDC1, mitochondrial-like n=1 Tax=Amphibalanus amphitrite TaxID=1232801 RepID=UPI001C8FF9DE|nr:complex I assembly factor TIMMDC1, mitochondrial-like [Amphibalanus amphitrite]XP_043207167.1 complex I assembly factor TIMMDC1, mitochondrial-like [Amphibalanus amphitrite]XP_043207175.1 complex I assembly factor TIMMDC1, mitochondrial-like [Amphibalanus amphitrite]XP_043207183.1 complex I assembly factor TIMMDC1, mitochondrial-like [Amphibalanus amphitrite]